MIPNNKQKWIDVLGAVGVIASLVFVGFEVRQNTAAVRGATYQAISDASLQHVQWWAENEKLLQFWVRIYIGAMSDDFTDAENLLIGAAIENIYVQVREGLVEEDAFLRFRPSKDFFDTPYFLEFWAKYRNTMEPEFRDYFEREFKG